MTLARITCMEPGCTNAIWYDPKSADSGEVPLYCEKHRTAEGRHSATRDMRR